MILIEETTVITAQCDRCGKQETNALSSAGRVNNYMNFARTNLRTAEADIMLAADIRRCESLGKRMQLCGDCRTLIRQVTQPVRAES